MMSVETRFSLTLKLMFLIVGVGTPMILYFKLNSPIQAAGHGVPLFFYYQLQNNLNLTGKGNVDTAPQFNEASLGFRDVFNMFKTKNPNVMYVYDYPNILQIAAPEITTKSLDAVHAEDAVDYIVESGTNQTYDVSNDFRSNVSDFTSKKLNVNISYSNPIQIIIKKLAEAYRNKNAVSSANGEGSQTSESVIEPLYNAGFYDSDNYPIFDRQNDGSVRKRRSVEDEDANKPKTKNKISLRIFGVLKTVDGTNNNLYIPYNISLEDLLSHHNKNLPISDNLKAFRRALTETLKNILEKDITKIVRFSAYRDETDDQKFPLTKKSSGKTLEETYVFPNVLFTNKSMFVDPSNVSQLKEIYGVYKKEKYDVHNVTLSEIDNFSFKTMVDKDLLEALKFMHMKLSEANYEDDEKLVSKRNIPETVQNMNITLELLDLGNTTNISLEDAMIKFNDSLPSVLKQFLVVLKIVKANLGKSYTEHSEKLTPKIKIPNFEFNFNITSKFPGDINMTDILSNETTKDFNGSLLLLIRDFFGDNVTVETELVGDNLESTEKFVSKRSTPDTTNKLNRTSQNLDITNINDLNNTLHELGDFEIASDPSNKTSKATNGSLPLILSKRDNRFKTSAEVDPEKYDILYTEHGTYTLEKLSDKEFRQIMESTMRGSLLVDDDNSKLYRNKRFDVFKIKNVDYYDPDKDYILETEYGRYAVQKLVELEDYRVISTFNIKNPLWITRYINTPSEDMSATNIFDKPAPNIVEINNSNIPDVDSNEAMVEINESSLFNIEDLLGEETIMRTKVDETYPVKNTKLTVKRSNPESGDILNITSEYFEIHNITDVSNNKRKEDINGSEPLVLTKRDDAYDSFAIYRQQTQYPPGVDPSKYEILHTDHGTYTIEKLSDQEFRQIMESTMAISHLVADDSGALHKIKRRDIFESNNLREMGHKQEHYKVVESSDTKNQILITRCIRTPSNYTSSKQAFLDKIAPKIDNITDLAFSGLTEDMNGSLPLQLEKIIGEDAIIWTILNKAYPENDTKLVLSWNNRATEDISNKTSKFLDIHNVTNTISNKTKRNDPFAAKQNTHEGDPEKYEILHSEHGTYTLEKLSNQEFSQIMETTKNTSHLVEDDFGGKHRLKRREEDHVLNNASTDIEHYKVVESFNTNNPLLISRYLRSPLNETKSKQQFIEEIASKIAEVFSGTALRPANFTRSDNITDMASNQEEVTLQPGNFSEIIQDEDNQNETTEKLLPKRDINDIYVREFESVNIPYTNLLSNKVNSFIHFGNGNDTTVDTEITKTETNIKNKDQVSK